jgi:BirA family biotin operon repressor/biotin-[acetyl-CoA-carboxylase] ligase
MGSPLSIQKEYDIKPAYRIIEGGGLWSGRLITFDRLPSTNAWAMRNSAFCRHGDVIWTMHQTKGRGRFSRSWVSPESSALTVSVVLSEIFLPGIPSQVGQLAALSILKTLEQCNIRSQLKWPNDVMVKGKKISGILSELNHKNKKIIVGIGININTTEKEFCDANLNTNATSMYMESGASYEIEAVLKILQTHLENYLRKAEKEGSHFIVTEWTEHDWLMNSIIEIKRGKIKSTGLYAGLDKQGRIRIIDNSGHEQMYWDGDVQKIKVFKLKNM